MWRAWVVLVGALGLNCRDATAPRSLAGHLAFAPAFPSSSAGIVDFDRVRITLVRLPIPGTAVLDTVIAIPATADSVDLSLNVPLLSSREDLALFLRLLNVAGDTVFKNQPYPQVVTVTTGATGTIVPAPLQYVGVGYDAVAVVIGTLDTTVLFGDTLRLSATAWGSLEQPIPGTPIAWRSLDSARVVVPDRAVGRVVGGAQRGAARVVAELLTGPADTMIVTAQPVPTVLTRIGGDGQTAVPLAPLPQPLRVRVTAGDGLGVRVPVAFSALATGAAVSADTVASDSLGYAEVTATLGPGVGPQSFEARVNGIATPIGFTATAVSGAVASVTLDRTVDTIPRGATLQYTAVARDSLGNPVSVTIGWSSTVPAVATVDGAGLASAVAGDSTRIIASAAGHADTARLYVRVLRSVVAAPTDTVVTAVGDSFDLRATAYDNFGGVLTAGFTRTFVSATPTVVAVNAATGRTRSVGPGNGVIVVRDSVDAGLKVQGTATVRVNQVVASVVSLPSLPDTLRIGVGGRGQVTARAFDRNGYPIPGKTFGFASRDTRFATVDANGLVTGVALGPAYIVDSLVEGVNVYRDSTLVDVVAAPPATIQWGFDSLAVGNGGSVSVPLTLSRTDPGPVTVLLASSDTLLARPATGCPGGALKRIQIPANTAATSVLLCGLAAGRVTFVAQDSAGVFLPDTMVVTVVSTIEFREIGQFSRQSNFYVNQNETHQAQVFLSDPAPAGGLGVTFVYGRAGTSAVSPSPAIIPAGQLSANVTIQGLTPGRDSVVPTSGGFVGKFAYVNVAPDSLKISVPYPYAVGVGQTIDPYVYYTYAMDHPLNVSLGLSPAIGTVPDTVTVPTNSYYRYFTVKAAATGTATVTATAPGWVGASATITFTTPQLGAGGSTSMVAGDPTRGSWSAYTQDSIVRYTHPVMDTVFVTATSRDTTVVAVDAPVGKVRPGQASVSVGNALRAQPAAGGQSTWIVLTAPGHRPDSFQVNVTAPALTFALSYPSQVMLGGRFQSAGYVSIPYVRPDSFTVVFAHTRRGIVSGPDSVTIPKGQTYVYFDIVGDTVAVDTIGVARATGYTIPPARPFSVVPIHVAIYGQPTTLYTISRPQGVSVLVRQETSPFYANPLVAPLRVNLASSNPAAFTLDSTGVTIPAGAYISNYDTLRVNPASLGNDSGRVLISAPGSSNDSSSIIRVLPTPLTLSIPYPQQAAYRLRLQNGYVYIPDVAPDTVRITLSQRLPLADSLSTVSVTIPRGQSYSNYFDVIGLDSAGTDTITAAAPGYVSSSQPVTVVPSQIDVSDIGPNHLTTEPPYRVTTYVRMRPSPQYVQAAIDTVRFTIVSTDSNVIQIDSAATVSATLGSGTSLVARDQYYAYFKIRFVGSGTARVIVSAPGFGVDTMAPVTVTGPVLRLGYQNITAGVGQVFQNQYVYVDNPVTGAPLVVTLAKSDSGLAPASQAFLLSAASVTIPVGQIYSPSFDLTGQTVGSAQLIARATGYGQATTTVSVGPPQLDVPPTVSLYVGEVPRGVTVYTRDQASAVRVVAAPLVVSETVSDPAVAVGDSASRTIAAGQSSTTFNFRALTLGSVSAIVAAAGYKADTMVVSVDTGQLAFGSVPTTIGPGQTAQMYVYLPFTNDSAITVTLASSDPGVLTVPSSAVIPARNGSVYFSVTGVANGTATITATATGKARSGTSPGIPVGTPKLQLFFAANTNVGQKYTLTVYAQDSLGVARNVAAPLTVTLASSDPTRTTFDSSSITIPTGSYYASTGITFTQAGSYTITGTAPGHASATAPSNATGALVQMQAGTVFAPVSVTIRAGEYVTWRNSDAIGHTTTEDSATPLWNSGTLGPGGSFQRYFPATGTYTYHCGIHAGMNGTVVVNP